MHTESSRGNQYSSEEESEKATTQIAAVVSAELMADIDEKIGKGAFKNRSDAIRKGLELLRVPLAITVTEKQPDTKTGFEKVMIAAQAFLTTREKCSGVCENCPIQDICKATAIAARDIDEFYEKLLDLTKDNELQRMLAALKQMEG